MIQYKNNGKSLFAVFTTFGGYQQKEEEEEESGRSRPQLVYIATAMESFTDPVLLLCRYFISFHFVFMERKIYHIQHSLILQNIIN
jgi:hypothetical protein